MKELASTLTSFTPFLTSVRLVPYQLTFDITNDHELMGAYLWSQQGASALYPLFHFVEIFIRNAIDKEAKRRFGEFWWDKISYNNTQHACKCFIENIDNAKEKLERDWRKAEKKRQGLKRGERLIDPCPEFSHDQIIAATEFSTWTFILTNGFMKPKYLTDTNKEYLWPQSLGKVFKHFNTLDSSPHKALKILHDNLTDIRNHRNRVFHHEPIWIKGDTQKLNSIRAIETIRHKINKMEEFIKVINSNIYQNLYETNIFNNARRVCSKQELEIYQGKAKTNVLKDGEDVILQRSIITTAQLETICIDIGNQLFSFSRMF